jgi:hypothetical protein
VGEEEKEEVRVGVFIDESKGSRQHPPEPFFVFFLSVCSHLQVNILSGFVSIS